MVFSLRREEDQPNLIHTQLFDLKHSGEASCPMSFACVSEHIPVRKYIQGWLVWIELHLPDN